jgi:hypothetical protein
MSGCEEGPRTIWTPSRRRRRSRVLTLGLGILLWPAPAGLAGAGGGFRRVVKRAGVADCWCGVVAALAGRPGAPAGAAAGREQAGIAGGAHSRGAPADCVQPGLRAHLSHSAGPDPACCAGGGRGAHRARTHCNSWHLPSARAHVACAPPILTPGMHAHMVAWRATPRTFGPPATRRQARCTVGAAQAGRALF